jgi:hypothetical protein
MEQVVVCPDCIRMADAVRLAGGLTVKVQEDRLLVTRGSAVVEGFPLKVRYLVDGLLEVVDQATGG